MRRWNAKRECLWFIQKEKDRRRAGIGQGPEQGPIMEAHDVGSVDRAEQVPGLLDGEFGGLSV